MYSRFHNMEGTKRFGPYCILVTMLILSSCGEQPMRTLDIPNPNDESIDSVMLSDESEDSGLDSIANNAYLEITDTTEKDSMPNLRTGTMDTTSINALPVNSTLKTIQAVFLSADCSGSRCELIFEDETEVAVRFCGAYGDFISADLRSANREMIGKKFMVIYRTGTDKSKSKNEKEADTNCNIIVFAKPL